MYFYELLCIIMYFVLIFATKCCLNKWVSIMMYILLNDFFYNFAETLFYDYKYIKIMMNIYLHSRHTTKFKPSSCIELVAVCFQVQFKTSDHNLCNQPVFALSPYCCVLSREATNTQLVLSWFNSTNDLPHSRGVLFWLLLSFIFLHMNEIYTLSNVRYLRGSFCWYGWLGVDSHCWSFLFIIWYSSQNNIQKTINRTKWTPLTIGVH
jgi:hypothetical protein